MPDETAPEEEATEVVQPENVQWASPEERHRRAQQEAAKRGIH